MLLFQDIPKISVMNKNVSREIQDKWPQFEFRGKPFIINSKQYIRVRWKNGYYKDFWYCFEDDAAYFDKPNTDDTLSLHT